MAKHVSFDTNLVVRLLVTLENPKQSAAILRAVERYDIIHLSDLAITESIFVLSSYYRLERADIAEFMSKLLSNGKFAVNRTMFSKALLYFVNHPALSFEDCCLAVYAHLNKAEPLLTFDKKLATQLPYTELLVTN